MATSPTTKGRTKTARNPKGLTDPTATRIADTEILRSEIMARFDRSQRTMPRPCQTRGRWRYGRCRPVWFAYHAHRLMAARDEKR